MPVLVDAYNVLHVVGVLPPEHAGIDLEELADLIAASRYAGHPVLLVCDGTPKPHRVSTPGVKVRFAGAGRTADDRIIDLIRRSSAPRRLTVVTSDREIATAARRRRATVVTSEAFLARLGEDLASLPRRPGTPAGDSSVQTEATTDRWLEVFGIEEDDPMLETPPSSTPPSSTPPSVTPPRDDDEPPGRSDRKPPRSPGPGILDARTLSDIDPRDLESLDVDRLLGDSDAEDPPNPRR